MKQEAKTDTGKERADGPVRVSVSLNPEDYVEIKGIAKEKRVSIAWVVRDAVADYLDARTPLFARKGRGEHR